MTTEHLESSSGGQPHGPRPTALADQLRWVHDMLRRDLVAVQQLAHRVSDGATATEVAADLQALRSNGPLFQLRVNCLSYCQTLGSHHRNEDTVLFPAVRRAAPHLAEAVDRLEADHLIVAALLDRIDGLADHLAERTARADLAAVLDKLAVNLLTHLDFEESALQPVLETWSAAADQTPSEIRDELDRRTS